MLLWSYSVLALLSEGYPHSEGRLPTYYSPVCHFTHELPRFLVRLACIRHAASVRSEPGSNSSVKVLSQHNVLISLNFLKQNLFKEKDSTNYWFKEPITWRHCYSVFKDQMHLNSRVWVLVTPAVTCQQLCWRSFNGSRKFRTSTGWNFKDAIIQFQWRAM